MSLSADGLGATLVPRSKLKTLVFNLSQIVFPDRQFVSILKYELDLLFVSIYSKLSPIEWAKTGTWKKARVSKSISGMARSNTRDGST